MPQVELALKAGGSVTLNLPEPGTGRSIFLLSLPKAGSTMFFRIMKPLSQQAGLSYFSLPNTLHELGVPTAHIATKLKKLFEADGYAYGGFRGIEDPIKLPRFASGRTAVLVRDPRDMLTSLYFSEAFSHNPPGDAASDVLTREFEARRKAALAETIDDFVLRRSSGILSTFVRTLGKIEKLEHRLYRYEDVIFDKAAWIGDLVDHLGLSVEPGRVERVTARNDLKPAVEDISQHARRVSPGDHREKLSAPVIARLNETFAAILDRFGYER